MPDPREFGTERYPLRASGLPSLMVCPMRRTEWTQLLDIHAYQVAAYCVMATELLGEPVSPGALIRTAGYFEKGVDPSQ
jgi:hypothetical protein